ncbi:MAG TPA: hypothetical protein PLB41_07745 [Rubrivivax sp.]|nr:hypothetical protein [Rubrivivax sp.]
MADAAAQRRDVEGLEPGVHGDAVAVTDRVPEIQPVPGRVMPARRKRLANRAPRRHPAQLYGKVTIGIDAKETS